MKEWICSILEICVMLGTAVIIYFFPEDGLSNALIGFVCIYTIDTVKKIGVRMNEELKQKAEDFIIDRYKIAECYREDNAETREYMRNDVHSQYEEEYQLYFAGATEATKELETQIEKMKQDLDNARENANRQEQWEIYSVLNDIYNDNFEVITSISN